MKTTKTFRIAAFLIMLLIVVVFMYPLYLMLYKSFLYKGFENYRTVFAAVNIRSNLLNSVIVVTLTMLGVTFASSLAAFAFSKLRFRGSGFLFILVLMGMMIPASATIFPLFQIIKSMKLVNSVFSLAGPYIASNAIFNLLVLKNYYDGLPNELIEAGRIDGAVTLRIFTSIIPPEKADVLNRIIEGITDESGFPDGGEHLGLGNVQRRLRQYYPQGYGIRVSARTGGGTAVIIKFQKQKEA